MNTLKKFLPIILLLLLSIGAILPLFHQGFFPMHDDTQVARVFAMHKSLSDGMFPVRWVADLGYNYGYPIFNFYAPLAYYFGGFAMFVGIDSLIATKLTMVVGILLAGVLMYFFAKEFWGRTGGVISALLYVYAPYHALNIYVRGDVAEFWAYAFIPLVFYGIWKTYKERKWLYIVLGSFGFAGVILSHNLTAMMITPFIFVFCTYLYIISRGEKKLNKPFYPLLIILLGIMVASFYWIPVFSRKRDQSRQSGRIKYAVCQF